jgi:hypothetical protein
LEGYVPQEIWVLSAVPPKLRALSELHRVRTQKIVIFIATDPTDFMKLQEYLLYKFQCKPIFLTAIAASAKS